MSTLCPWKFPSNMKILIVDDEKLARERLASLLNEEDESLQIALAENGMSCVEMASTQDYDVVLLDIRMPGMDGIETAGHLAGLPTPPAIVFTTAYDDHAIEAFNANAVDYLLKPIRRERLSESLERARLQQLARVADLKDRLAPEQKTRTHLSATLHGNIELIPVAEIRYLRADNKYVTVGWPGHETFVDEALKSLETEFAERFIRVHRNALVARDYIESLEKDEDGKTQLRLRGVDASIDVSRRHLHELKQLIRKRMVDRKTLTKNYLTAIRNNLLCFPKLKKRK